MPILIICLYASKDFNVEENKIELDVPLKHLNNENLVCGNEERPTKDAETPEKRSARLATESIAKRQQRVSETECFDCNNLPALGRIGLPVNQMIRGLLDYSIKDNHRVTRLAVKQNMKGLLDYSKRVPHSKVGLLMKLNRKGLLDYDVMLSNIE